MLIETGIKPPVLTAAALGNSGGRKPAQALLWYQWIHSSLESLSLLPVRLDGHAVPFTTCPGPEVTRTFTVITRALSQEPEPKPHGTGIGYLTKLTLIYPLWWLFSTVKLTTLGTIAPKWRAHQWRVFAYFEVMRSTSNPDLWTQKVHTFNLDLLSREDLPRIWAMPYAGHLCKEHGRKQLLVFACMTSACRQIYSFTGIGACFPGSPAHTKARLRHPGLWTEWLPGSWSFSSQPAIVELGGPQPVSHSEKPSHIERCIF